MEVGARSRARGESIFERLSLTPALSHWPRRLSGLGEGELSADGLKM